MTTTIISDEFLVVSWSIKRSVKTIACWLKFDTMC